MSTGTAVRGFILWFTQKRRQDDWARRVAVKMRKVGREISGR